MREDVNRRVFLERLGAGVIGGAALSQGPGLPADAQGGPSLPDTTPWSTPPALVNPNILIILVDQMRWPCWLSRSQRSLLNSEYLPNIFGQLRNNSYVFQQYYVAATACTPSRAALLTGLYPPQTAMYSTEQTTCVPTLVPAFPTWASALNDLATPYANNVWWFGKWHLSDSLRPNGLPAPLAQYGFNTGLYPGAFNPSPNGLLNEGVNGGVNTLGSKYQGITFASDAQIAGDFINWLTGQAGYTVPSSPWCATVSLINPHDIGGAPDWLPPSPFPWNANNPAYYPQPAFPPSWLPGQGIYSNVPNPWNFENQFNLAPGIKPSLQLDSIKSANEGRISGAAAWIQFLNQYYWLQSYVDQQVGNILNALKAQNLDGNTIVIFTTDHGEYGGSHGMRGKSHAVYDEAIHVPLYIHFPGQTGMIALNQMCSAVDFFRLICDVGTLGGTLNQPFLTTYPDQANRQRIWDFLYNNGRETRVSQVLGIPYVLHTTDDRSSNSRSHVVCLRGKGTGTQSAKLAIYSEWASGTAYPDSTTPEYEFYDYSSVNNNTRELGNNYSADGATALTGTANPSLQSAYLTALGSWGGWSSPTTPGIVANELNAPLTGNGTDGKPLSQAQATAQQNYFTYMSGGCPPPS